MSTSQKDLTKYTNKANDPYKILSLDKRFRLGEIYDAGKEAEKMGYKAGLNERCQSTNQEDTNIISYKI